MPGQLLAGRTANIEFMGVELFDRKLSEPAGRGGRYDPGAAGRQAGCTVSHEHMQAVRVVYIGLHAVRIVCYGFVAKFPAVDVIPQAVHVPPQFRCGCRQHLEIIQKVPGKICNVHCDGMVRTVWPVVTGTAC